MGKKITIQKETAYMKILSQIWFSIQQNLFPFLEEEISPLTSKQKQLIATLELVRIEEYIHVPWYRQGQLPKNRRQIGRAFVAKAVYNMDTTRQLIDRLQTDISLRRICGWEKVNDIPHESSFSRAFAEFAKRKLSQLVHTALVERHLKDQLIGHISRDSTAIEGRERVTKKAEAPKKKKKKKKGRSKHSEKKTKTPTRLEQQQNMGLDEMIKDLPNNCDVGTKKNSKGYKESWKGFKLHIDAADGHLPISCILTSASVHDSQAALPLAEMTAKQTTNLYDLMDSAYDSPIIREHSKNLGHIPIIDINTRRNTDLKRDLQEEANRLNFLNFKSPKQQRYNERTNIERVNGRLKDEFGGRTVRVRGAVKVMTHLMFGILVLTADQLFKLII